MVNRKMEHFSSIYIFKKRYLPKEKLNNLLQSTEEEQDYSDILIRQFIQKSMVKSPSPK